MHCTNLDSHLLFNQVPPKLQPGSSLSGHLSVLGFTLKLGDLSEAFTCKHLHTIQHLSLRRFKQMLESCRYKIQWIKL